MNAHMADLRGTGAATAAAAVGSADGGDALQAALAEVAQLRRENARLRAQQASTLVGPLMHKQLGSVAPSDGRADGLKRRSFEMTGARKDMDSWVKMAQNRAHMRGAGFEDADFTKPIVTVQHPPPCSGARMASGSSVLLACAFGLRPGSAGFSGSG